MQEGRARRKAKRYAAAPPSPTSSDAAGAREHPLRVPTNHLSASRFQCWVLTTRCRGVIKDATLRAKDGAGGGLCVQKHTCAPSGPAGSGSPLLLFASDGAGARERPPHPRPPHPASIVHPLLHPKVSCAIARAGLRNDEGIHPRRRTRAAWDLCANFACEDTLGRNTMALREGICL
ncbi:hypothetical protein MSAN_01367100 [Mycena sanguinolenta]|uniref:Uncharacterized protein n=1 Tax=Mycena sanguinolenta TaxID=230812 RepID=A0A8H6YA11_9AGAR|nr:hypothetical protein MSAN_01367100 [Mycena sanguinolenta]